MDEQVLIHLIKGKNYQVGCMIKWVNDWSEDEEHMGGGFPLRRFNNLNLSVNSELTYSGGKFMLLFPDLQSILGLILTSSSVSAQVQKKAINNGAQISWFTVETTQGVAFTLLEPKVLFPLTKKTPPKKHFVLKSNMEAAAITKPSISVKSQKDDFHCFMNKNLKSQYFKIFPRYKRISRVVHTSRTFYMQSFGYYPNGVS